MFDREIGMNVWESRAMAYDDDDDDDYYAPHFDGATSGALGLSMFALQQYIHSTHCHYPRLALRDQAITVTRRSRLSSYSPTLLLFLVLRSLGCVVAALSSSSSVLTFGLVAPLPAALLPTLPRILPPCRP